MALSLEAARITGKEKAATLRGGKVVIVIPDATRSGTKYVGAIIKGIYEGIAAKAESVTALIALGTHKAMAEEAIFKTFGFTPEEMKQFPKLEFANHEWQDQTKLRTIGTFSREDMLRISGNRFDLSDVREPNGFPIEVNYRVAEGDSVIIVGPVLNHEVVGKSGGTNTSSQEQAERKAPSSLIGSEPASLSRTSSESRRLLFERRLISWLPISQSLKSAASLWS